MAEISMTWTRVGHCFVDGSPRPQPRARVCAVAGGARMYDPGTSANWKKRVRAKFRPPGAPLSGPVYVRLLFALKRPKRLLRKRDPDGMIPHAAKPDCDNLAKAVLDAMDGWWKDDCQVQRLEVAKFYSSKDRGGGCYITVWTHVAPDGRFNPNPSKEACNGPVSDQTHSSRSEGAHE